MTDGSIEDHSSLLRATRVFPCLSAVHVKADSYGKRLRAQAVAQLGTTHLLYYSNPCGAFPCNWGPECSIVYVFAVTPDSLAL